MHFDLTPDSIAAEFVRRARLDTGEPINLEALAHRHGLRLIIAEHEYLHGASIGDVVIYDGSRDVLAHELAHVAWRRVAGDVDVDEAFIIAIAAALVVPRLAFDRARRWGASIEQLAEKFDVQQTCAALRIGEITGEPIAVWCGPGRLIARGEWRYPRSVVERMVRQRHRAFNYARIGDRAGRLIIRVPG